MKTVFITGGSTGIGAAAVKKFIAQGWNAGFMDINVKDAEALTSSLNVPDRLLFTEGNTRNREDIRRAVEATGQAFGRLDSVVANAGIHRCNTLLDIADEELDLMIQTNIYGTVYTLQETVPYLIENGGGAVVINDSDQFYIGKGNSFAYGLTKGALGQITRSLAIDLGPKNVRVNAVCPATIHTPLADGAMGRYAQRAGLTLEQAWAEEDTLYPLGCFCESVVVAALVFLLVDQGTFCTGGHYLVDGGLVAHS